MYIGQTLIIQEERKCFQLHKLLHHFNLSYYKEAGAQLGNFEMRGRRYIYNRKDEIIHGLSPSVKCVAPLFRDMSIAKVSAPLPKRPPPLRPCKEEA